jgi:hypothetical protein
MSRRKKRRHVAALQTLTRGTKLILNQSNQLISWLKKQRGAVLVLFCSILAFVGGLVALFLTFWFAYAVIYVGWEGVSAVSELIFNKQLHLAHEWRLAISGVFIAILFVEHFRISPWYWGEYPRDNYVSSPVLQWQAGIFGALAFMLAYPGVSANMIADIFMVGPRLICGAFPLVREALRLARLDERSCAELLGFLASQTKSVSYDELRNAGWETWLSQLRNIEGVIFLEKGLSLSDDLRQELNSFGVT